MQNTFTSKVFIGNKKKNLALSILLFLISIIIILCVLIKLIVGDFHFSDISGILISVLILNTCRNNRRPKPQYATAMGKIDFSNEGMTITYEDVDGGKALGRFTETTNIRYEDIECIQFGQQLSCYRIVAKCIRKRFFYDFGRERELENGEKTANTYVYIMDEDEDVELRRNLQKYTGCIVAIIDAGVEEENE